SPTPSPSPIPYPTPAPRPYPTPSPSPSPTPDPRPEPTPEPRPDTDAFTGDTDRFDKAFLNLVNQERAKQGLKRLRLDGRLDKAADQHSEAMAEQDFFSTNGNGGTALKTRIEKAGYQPQQLSQTIGGGYSSADAFFKALMRSSGTRNKLLDPKATDLGLGLAKLSNDSGKVNYTNYWTQVVASSKASIPAPKPSPVPNPSPRDPFTGTNKNDTLRGNSRSQTLKGLAGNDRIFAGGGDDRAYGGDGNDLISTSNGNDRAYGGSGNDRIRGGDGQDYIYGEAGNDVLLGSTNSNRNAGRGEKDVLHGGAGADKFIIGDRNKAFYNDGKKGTAGANDFAYILDFNAAQGDQIQLHGRASDYRLGSISLGSEKAVAIYLQQEGQDELVAALRGNGGFNLQSSAARVVS
ncbi:MAG: CAP domain-containing protein, partial [Phormidesmis sp.]